MDLLKDEFDFYILTSNHDVGDKKPLKGVKFDEWVYKDNFHVYYMSKSAQKINTFKKLLFEKTYHRYYFNSLFSLWYTIIPLYLLKSIGISKRAILAPRGMLGSGALKIKAFKKGFFLHASKSIALFKFIKWHASTVMEAKEIRMHFGNDVKIEVAMNVAQKPQINIERDKLAEVKFIFLSRISQKKNLLGAISMFDELKFNKKVSFDIYGPIEDESYWQKCKQKMESINSNVSIRYKGSLQRSKIFPTLVKYHFMLFPTFNENYGHNIAEALLCGLPVIISDQTPWQKLETYKAGWDIPLDEQGRFHSVITKAVNMSNDEYQQWQKGALDYAEQKFFSKEIYTNNKQIFL